MDDELELTDPDHADAQEAATATARLLIAIHEKAPQSAGARGCSARRRRTRMPKHLTCEADINFPVPDIHQLTAQLRSMYDGQTPVTARALALSFGLVEGAIVPVLRRAEQCEMVRNIDCRGWVPLQT